MRDWISEATFRIFKWCMMMMALGAYAIGPVPIPWLGQITAIAVAVWLGFKARVKLPPGMTVFTVFFVYAVVVTLAKSAFGDYHLIMPSNSTTGYFTFINLRFFTLASFGAFTVCTYWLLTRGYRPEIMRFLAFLCLFLSVSALYIYIAQVYGLPEPPRTRVGTTGGEQATKFSYAFHRAMGTFREPSHLAEFMILPILATLSQTGRLFTISRVFGIITLFLTGSLTGIMSLFTGLTAGFILFPYMSAKTFRILGRLVIIVFVGMVGFTAAVSGYKGQVDLVTVLWQRVEPIAEKGAAKSNRDYIYNYFKKQELQWIGDGLGNSNLKFAQAMNSGVPVAFLNIFVNFVLSLGYFGFGMFIVFLLTPFFLLLMNRNYKYESVHYLILASFVAWMVAFSVHSEELSLSFAVVYALIVHAFSEQKTEGVKPSSSVYIGAKQVVGLR